MSQTIQSNPQAMVESVARGLAPDSRDDFRLLMNEVVIKNLTALSPGGNLITPDGPQSGASAAPAGVTHTATGANGVVTVAIANPSNVPPTGIWHEMSYDSVSSFTKNPTIVPATQATSITIPNSGVNAYYRLRSSFDKVNWGPYQLSSTSPIDAGLVGSDAIEPASVLNQTNYAEVNSQLSGEINTVTVNGTGGLYTPYTAVRGSQQFLRPSATIIGLQSGTSQYVGFDGNQFHLVSNLAHVMPDNLEPVGAVVVGSGVPGGGGVTGGNGGRLTNV
jgi:hypothetical protein